MQAPLLGPKKNKSKYFMSLQMATTSRTSDNDNHFGTSGSMYRRALAGADDVGVAAAALLLIGLDASPMMVALLVVEAVLTSGTPTLHLPSLIQGT